MWSERETCHSIETSKVYVIFYFCNHFSERELLEKDRSKIDQHQQAMIGNSYNLRIEIELYKPDERRLISKPTIKK